MKKKKVLTRDNSIGEFVYYDFINEEIYDDDNSLKKHQLIKHKIGLKKNI